MSGENISGALILSQIEEILQKCYLGMAEPILTDAEAVARARMIYEVKAEEGLISFNVDTEYGHVEDNDRLDIPIKVAASSIPRPANWSAQSVSIPPSHNAPNAFASFRSFNGVTIMVSADSRTQNLCKIPGHEPISFEFTVSKE